MTRRTPLKRKPRKKQPGDDPKYRDWIATLPCLICGKLAGLAGDVSMLEFLICSLLTRQKSRTEAHHAGDHGYAQLPPDRTCIPLCAEHHRTGKDAAHGPLGKNFWKHHDIDRDAMIAALNSAYERYNQLHV
jgi:hypothetical protein